MIYAQAGPERGALRLTRLWLFFAMITAFTVTTLVSAPAQSAPQWEALAGLDNDVEDIEFGPDGTLYAGGQFTGNVASWDGTGWQVLGGTGPGIGNVTSLAFDPDGNLYAGGNGGGHGGSAPFVAKWNGTAWSSLAGYSPDDDVEALLFSRGLLFAAGDGSVANGYAASWDGTAWTKLDQGALADTVYALAALSNGTILAGSGDSKVWELSGTTWSALGLSAPGINTVYSIAIGPGDRIYAGGQVDPEIVTYNAGTGSWDPVSPSVAEADPADSNRIFALVASADGTLYAGGFYSLVTGTQTLDWLGVLSSGSWSSPGPSFFDARIREFTFASDGTLYAAGDFTGFVARFVDSEVSGGVSSTAVVTQTLSLDGGQGVTCRQGSAVGRQGTWITLPGTSDCTPPSDTPNATLLGWATARDFPLDIARRQVTNGWGAYEMFDDTGKLSAVFIPAGGPTFLSGSGNLYAVWNNGAAETGE